MTYLNKSRVDTSCVVPSLEITLTREVFDIHGVELQPGDYTLTKTADDYEYVMVRNGGEPHIVRASQLKDRIEVNNVTTYRTSQQGNK